MTSSSSSEVYELFYDEYAALTQKYKALYGELTIVTVQVGKFLEYYNCDQNLGVDVKAISRILGIQATRKNKLIREISRKNPEFTGFPLDKSPKFIALLLEAGYTVVLYMQKGEAPNITREVVEVVSPSTATASAFLSGSLDGVENVETISSTCMMSIYLDATTKNLSCGWAVVDLSTGRSHVSESSHAPLDSLRRAVVSYRPAETVFFREGKDLPAVETVCAHAGLRRRAVHDRSDRYKSMMSPARQNAILEKAYPNTGFLSPAEFVNLERRRDALIALVAAIEFAFEHNPSVISRIHVPEIVAIDACSDDDDETNERSWMDLGPDTVRQLDVVTHAKSDAFEEPQATLMDVLNRCRTPSGKRAFKDRLLHPVCNAKTLQSRYDAIEGLMAPRPSGAEIDDLISLLDGIGDVEKAFRKVVNLKRLSTRVQDDLSTIASWLKNSEDAIVAWKGGKTPASEAARSVWAAIDARIDPTPGIDSGSQGSQGALGGSEIRSYFRRGVHPTVDAAQDELDMSIAVFHSAASALNSAIGADHVKVDSESGGIIGLTVTAKRWNAAVASGATAKAIVEPWFVGSDAALGGPVSGNGKKEGGVRRLDHPALGSAASERVARARAALEAELREKTKELIEELDESHSDSVYAVVKEIDDLDVALACARNAKAMGHVRPVLVGDEAGSSSSSFLRAQGLRHPVIESLMLDRKERFVPNEIALGSVAPSVLLYGVNAVGKSSLMKSVGLAVIMAQSGMFVAAEAFELRPYRELYTRVGLRDDLTRGHSTFTVEMLELRTILRQATKNSLVIGDELCAGTESQSAVSIVGSAVSSLCDKKASFLFATHIHELVEIPTVATLVEEGRVRACHMSVHIEPGTQRLVMDRKLAAGTGPPTYGLEVCRSLDMDPTFLAKAEEIRRQVMGETTALSSTRRSRYNAKVIVDACGVCGKAALETHHLEHQAVASDHVKNRRYNLVPLCERCHDDVHAGKIDIEGYKTTSEGITLEVKRTHQNTNQN